MDSDNFLNEVEHYYSEKIQRYGATPQGVDWNSQESQTLRFEQLLKCFDISQAFSINDYGCGYGSLVDYLIQQGHLFQYRGFDISEAMIKRAKELHHELNQCEFFTEESRLTVADYTVASGIFNVKLGTSNETWQKYIMRMLKKFSELSNNGFAFNILTKYSDRDHMRPDLYYADPLFFFDYCKKNFSRYVSLLHDYPLFEFTIAVKK